MVLNQVRNRDEIPVGNAVKSVVIKYFGIDAEFAGYIEYDDFIYRCINKREPYMMAYPASRCAGELMRITERLTGVSRPLDQHPGYMKCITGFLSCRLPPLCRT